MASENNKDSNKGEDTSWLDVMDEDGVDINIDESALDAPDDDDPQEGTSKAVEQGNVDNPKDQDVQQPAPAHDQGNSSAEEAIPDSLPDSPKLRRRKKKRKDKSEKVIHKTKGIILHFKYLKVVIKYNHPDKLQLLIFRRS